MRIIKFVLTILFLGLLFIANSSAQAKVQLERITIDGPDLTTVIEVQESSVLGSLGMGGLENFNKPIDPPEINGPVYLVTRDYRDGEIFTPFDRLLYLPNPDGKRGAVYYIGIHNGYGPYDGEWYAASEAGEQALLSLLEERGAPQFKTDEAETASPSSQNLNWGLGAIAFVFGVLLTGGLIAQVKAQEHNHKSY